MEAFAGNQRARPGMEMSWESAKIRELESEYESFWDMDKRAPEKIAGDGGRDKYGEMLRLRDAFFRKHLSATDLQGLAVSCDRLPVHARERSRFANDLLAFMVKVFVELGDRDSLVTLLSARCPGRIVEFPPETIEYYLAFRGKNLENPILVLGEAYAKCAVAETRHDIAAAVRRGFADLGVRGKDDTDYVAEAMKWYAEEKDNVVASREFGKNDREMPLEAYERYPELYNKPGDWGRKPLFKKKEPFGQRRGGGGDGHQTNDGIADHGVTKASPESRLRPEGDMKPEMIEGMWRVIAIQVWWN
jgi:hypothetical protein